MYCVRILIRPVCAIIISFAMDREIIGFKHFVPAFIIEAAGDFRRVAALIKNPEGASLASANIVFERNFAACLIACNNFNPPAPAAFDQTEGNTGLPGRTLELAARIFA